MINLHLNNSESQIKGLTIPQQRKLTKILSYKISDREAYFAGGWAKDRPLINKSGVFPTGLVYLVHKFLQKQKLQYQTDDLRRVPKHQGSLFTLSLGVTPYPEQIDAARACKRGRGVIVAPTGCGKSLICALIINEMQVRTLVVVPSLELKFQLLESLMRTFGTKSVGSMKDKRNIVVENVDALNPDKSLEGYDCVIIDEFHHAAATTYQKLNKKAWGGVFHRFGLTATPYRNQQNEGILLESILAETIYAIDYDTAVSKGYIVPMEAFYIKTPDLNPKKSIETWGKFYKDYVVNHADRNLLISGLLESLQHQGKSTLCLVREIEHGEILSEMTGIPFANGQSGTAGELINKFNKLEIKCLIGTTGVLGEGIDTKPCEFIIIAGMGKSKPAFMQSCGRAFRRFGEKESCKIITLCDNNKWGKAHFASQVEILKQEYGVEPAQID